jgi:hypothetical protein
MASVRSAGRGFSPLDEELDLLPGTLTPRLQEQLAHLGTWMPFGPAAELFARFTGVAVSPVMARRLTEVVGRAYIAVQAAEVERLCDELPPVPTGARRPGAGPGECRWGQGAAVRGRGRVGRGQDTRDRGGGPGGGSRIYRAYRAPEIGASVGACADDGPVLLRALG